MIFATGKSWDSFAGAKKSAENLIIVNSIKGDFEALFNDFFCVITGFIHPRSFASEISLV